MGICRIIKQGEDLTDRNWRGQWIRRRHRWDMLGCDRSHPSIPVSVKMKDPAPGEFSRSHPFLGGYPVLKPSHMAHSWMRKLSYLVAITPEGHENIRRLADQTQGRFPWALLFHNYIGWFWLRDAYVICENIICRIIYIYI